MGVGFTRAAKDTVVTVFSGHKDDLFGHTATAGYTSTARFHLGRKCYIAAIILLALIQPIFSWAHTGTPYENATTSNTQ
jgi:hypothetical protein